MGRSTMGAKALGTTRSISGAKGAEARRAKPVLARIRDSISLSNRELRRVAGGLLD